MRLIINADDLGRSLEVNEAIFTFLDLGLVTSSTIIANSPHVDRALSNLAHFPRCSFGIHLNITEFRPLTPSPALGSLLDQTGNFSLAKFREAVFSHQLREAIVSEWEAQVRKLQSRGLAISHMDSHQGVHTEPRLFWVLKRLQHKFGLRKVRLKENIGSSSGKLHLRAGWWNLALRLIYRTRTTSGFTDFSTFLQVSPSLGGRYPTMEVMVHPGHPHFAGETAALLTSWRERLPFPVNLINYNEL